MADPVQKPDISPAPAAKTPPAKPKDAKSAPKVVAPAGKEVKAKPKEVSPQKGDKLRMEPIKINLGRSGLPQESAFPVKKEVKATPKPAPAAKPAGDAKVAPAAKAVAPGAKGVSSVASPAPKAVAVASAPQPAVKKSTPRAKSHYFIIENLCVGCGLCLDKCPPKVNAIGYKFYGDVQEGGFRCYIDQDACISCSACFSTDECPSGALVEILPDGEILDFKYTPPDRLDFDLRFLHRFHRESQ